MKRIARLLAGAGIAVSALTGTALAEPAPASSPAGQPVPASSPAPATPKPVVPAPALPAPGTAAPAAAAAQDKSASKPDPGIAVPPGIKVAALAPAIGKPGIPGNNVRCVFDNLSIEDREITLMQIGLDFQDRGRYTRIAPQNGIVDRIIADALARCAPAYHWTPAASAASVDYAHATLVIEILRQAIASEEHDVEPIDGFFLENRGQLSGKPDLDDLIEERFASHLKAYGWRESERSARRVARIYLEGLVAREASETAFDKATVRPAPKGSRRRAGKAARGKP